LEVTVFRCVTACSGELSALAASFPLGAWEVEPHAKESAKDRKSNYGANLRWSNYPSIKERQNDSTGKPVQEEPEPQRGC
jgi:hypothetical protein